MSLGGGGGTPTETRTTTTQELSPEQRELLQLVLPAARDFSANPPELFPGSQIQGFDPLQIQGQNLAVDAAQNFLSPLTQQGAQASQFLLGPVLFPESNPALQAATDAAIRPIQEQFTQSVLPNIGRQANLAGQVGGSRQGVLEANASRDFLRQVGDTSATIQAQAFQDSLDAMTQALGFLPQTTLAGLQPASAISGVGQQRQQLGQAQLSEEAQRFTAEQTIPFNVAQQIAALAFGFPGGPTNSVSQVPTPQSDPLSQLLGVAATAALFL